MCYSRFQDDNFVSENFRHTLVAGTVVQAAAAFCDILITGGLCYYFHKSKTGQRSTIKLLDKLMAYAVERGALTT